MTQLALQTAPPDTVSLHCGDCLDVMRGMDDNSVDAVISDPPFGIGFRYAKGKEFASNSDEYWAWFSPAYREMQRIAKPGALIAIWQTQLYFKHFWEWFGDDIHVYCAAKNFVQLRKTPINYAYDPVVMLYKYGAVPLRPSKPRRSLDFFVANTASVISNSERIEKAHPCPRPLDAVQEILANFALPKGLILDPFMGSGTTGVAAVAEGMQFVGIDKEAEYVELARQRIGVANQGE